MTAVAWMSLVAAVIAASAALMVGDILTVKGRLRRLLEKELAIKEKLPPGPLQDELETATERRTAELLAREQGPDAGWVVACMVVVVASWVSAFLQYRTQADNPSFRLEPAPSQLAAAGLFAFFIMLGVVWWRAKTIHSLIDKKVSDARNAGGPAPLPPEGSEEDAP